MKRTYHHRVFGATSALALLLGVIAYAQLEASPTEKATAAPSKREGDSCLTHDAWHGLIFGSPDTGLAPPEPIDVGSPPQSEAPFLKDLANWLSVPIPENATPGDIELAIKEALSETVTCPVTVLSDEAFKECYAVIPTTRDAEIFKEYHDYFKKIEGKRIVILKTTHK